MNTSSTTIRILICCVGSGSLNMQLWENGTQQYHATLEGKYSELLEELLTYLRSTPSLTTVLHRIVHLGEVGSEPQIVDDMLMARIRHWLPLAPLHNALALSVIEQVTALWPQAKQWVFSDSALYLTMPDIARCYALPENLSSNWPIKRYGFHGIAHQSQWRQLQQQKNFCRVITVHLGGGGSLTAWRDGSAVDTTMGFTPVEGIPMTTRSGSLDPSIVLHLLQRENYTVEQLSALFNNESGLKGLSGISGDYRELKAHDDEAADFAISAFCYQLSKALGSLMAVLGGVDAIAFGGGLAENQPFVREASLKPLATLGVSISSKKNISAQGVCALHKEDSNTEVWLTPADEGREIFHQFQTYCQAGGRV